VESICEKKTKEVYKLKKSTAGLQEYIHGRKGYPQVENDK